MAETQCSECGIVAKFVGTRGNGTTTIDRDAYLRLCKHITDRQNAPFDCPKLMEAVRSAARQEEADTR